MPYDIIHLASNATEAAADRRAAYAVSVVSTCVAGALPGVWVMSRGHRLPAGVSRSAIDALLQQRGYNLTALDLRRVPQENCQW